MKLRIEVWITDLFTRCFRKLALGSKFVIFYCCCTKSRSCNCNTQSFISGFYTYCCLICTGSTLEREDGDSLRLLWFSHKNQTKCQKSFWKTWNWNLLAMYIVLSQILIDIEVFNHGSRRQQKNVWILMLANRNSGSSFFSVLWLSKQFSHANILQSSFFPNFLTVTAALLHLDFQNVKQKYQKSHKSVCVRGFRFGQIPTINAQPQFQSNIQKLSAMPMVFISYPYSSRKQWLH